MPNLNIVICPGCGSQLPVENRGCPDCGYENNDDGRLLTIAEILERPSYPAAGAMRLNEVCPAFLKAVVTAARVAALQDAATMARSVSNIAESSTQNSYETKRAYRGVAGELECMVEREEKLLSDLQQDKSGKQKEEVVLQIFNNASGQFGGRILRDSVEDGRVAGCASQADVEHQANEAGIDVDRVEVLDYVPPVE